MLQKRLLFLLLPVILIPTLTAGWIAYRFSAEAMRISQTRFVEESAENLRRQLLVQLNQTDRRVSVFFSDFLSTCAATDKLDRDCGKRYLENFLQSEHAVSATLFRNEQSVLQANKGEEAVILDSTPDKFRNGGWRIHGTKDRPALVIGGNTASHWQLILIYPTEILQPILDAATTASGSNLLTANDGTVIIRSGSAESMFSNQPAPDEALQSCLHGQNGTIRDNDSDHQNLRNFRYLSELGGGCLVTIAPLPTNQTYTVAFETEFTVVTFFCLALTILSASALARQIVTPIARLTNTASRIRVGDLSLRAVVEGPDEIAELAKAFNHMTDALADAQHNLEGKVADRTRELRTSEERYMLAEGAVNDGIWDWNIAKHEYYISPHWNKILGYGEGELPNEETIFFDLLHPNDKIPASIAFQKHLLSNERYAMELRLRHKDGSYRWVLDRGQALRDAEGRPYRMVGSITDITERKAAEAELSKYREHLEEMVAIATSEVKALVQTAVNGVITIDTEGAIRMFNPAAERLFGWKAEEVLGRNVSLLMTETDASTHNNHIERFLHTNESRIIGIEREVTALKKNGTTFPANLAVGHGVLAEGRHFFVGFISDISLQKRAQQELRLAKEAAESAAKTKANFLANMSHEIRTPMNTVIGFAEVVLQNPNLQQETRDHVTTILNSAKHLLEIINDILDFSKIEAGKILLESVCFNLPAMVQETLQTIGLRAAEKGLKVELEIAPYLPQFFIGDPHRLRQVILNLVSNSIKFTEKGQIVLSVKQAAGTEMLHFSISDTGIGMTDEQIGKIFESFSQADTTTSRRFGGTGLGTTISKQLVELMGGRIWVESQFGVGTTFHFTINLPEADIQEHDGPDDQTSMPASAVGYFSPRGFRILLAEDVETNATLAILRLERQGHTVSWVKNGQEAVDAFATNNYDLILMDLQMPIMDGLTATRRIRALETGGSRIPILALTASVLQNEKEECLQAGMDAIVGKPIDIDELLQQMENLAPPDAGMIRTAIEIETKAQPNVDFNPLQTVADIGKALTVWREPVAYAEALASFAHQHSDAVRRMTQLYAETPENLQKIRQITHTLKGVSGNLALSEIFVLATELDASLNAGQTQNINKQFYLLDIALHKAEAAINSLRIPKQHQRCAAKPFDAEQVKLLLRQLMLSLDELNPDSAEPILMPLSQFLEPSDYDTLKREIEHFDFDAAKRETVKLLEKIAPSQP